jgi:predicted lipoprotein with Yx(FWY)xxD motif
MTFLSTYGQRGPRRRRPFAPLVSGALALATAAGSIAFATSPAMAQAAPTKISIEKNTAWGPVLATSTGMTVYRFVKDGMNKSNCSGACAEAWPPVLLAKGQTKPIGQGLSHLGVIMRSNGTHQVTYEGIPLYTFVRDTKGSIDGNIKDSFGQWWTVNPAQPKATPVKSGSGGSGSGGSGSGGSGSGGSGSSGPSTTAPSSGGVSY